MTNPWKATIMHVIAVAVSLGVATILIKLLGVDSPVVMGVIGLVVVALEKLVRAHNGIGVKDYVNN